MVRQEPTASRTVRAQHSCKRSAPAPTAVRMPLDDPPLNNAMFGTVRYGSKCKSWFEMSHDGPGRAVRALRRTRRRASSTDLQAPLNTALRH